MTALKLKDLDFSFENEEEEFEIPLDIEDIMLICREYSKLGWNLQSQIEAILAVGVETALKTGQATRDALPHIKDFLQQIINGVCVGNAAIQAIECIDLINHYQTTHKQVSPAN